MISKKYKQHITVESKDAMVFDQLLNRAIQEHSSQNVEVIYKMNADGHCAYVTYECLVKVAENLEDEYALQGISFSCGECPHFILPNDKRIKFIICDHSGHRRKCQFESRACEWLYHAVENGEIEI